MIVTGMFYYRNGTIRISGFTAKNDKLYTEKRGAIKRMSRKSKERLALFVAETQLKFITMVTLTYPAEYRITGKEAKDNLNKVLTYLRGEYPFIGYLWFMEFTKAGQVHFHILIDRQILSLGRVELARYWGYMIAKNHDDLEKIFYTHNREEQIGATRSHDGAKRYALKYALKSESKDVPTRFNNVGRFWGFNRKVKESIPKPDFIRISQDDFRVFLRSQGNPMCDAKSFPLIVFHRQIVSRETIGQNMDKSLTKA